MLGQASCSLSKAGVQYHPCRETGKIRSDGAIASSSQSHSQKVQKCGDVELDRISQLPEEILVMILSCLNIKEAGKCSVISRRWIHLWKLVAGKLEIGYEESVPTERATNHVSKVLNNLQGSNIDELRIHYVYRGQYSSYVDSWVKFALKKGVRHLELDLCEPLGLSRAERDFLENNLNDISIREEYFQQHLLENYRLRILMDCSFSSLTSLQLSYVDIKGGHLEHIISQCTDLRQLHLKWALSLVTLTVAGQSLKLKSLKIDCCYELRELNICEPSKLEKLELSTCSVLKKVNISAKNLVTLRYDGDFDYMFLENVPALSELSIGGSVWYTLRDKSCKFFNHILQLEGLRLQLPHQACIDRPKFRPKFPRLNRLKHLELVTYRASGEALLFLAFVIKACPSLHTFSMQYIYQPGELEELADRIATTTGAAKFEHKCLKVFELSGFVGYEGEFELILRLVAIAVSLERVDIQLSDRIRDKARDRAKLLESMLPPTVSLLLM